MTRGSIRRPSDDPRPSVEWRAIKTQRTVSPRTALRLLAFLIVVWLVAGFVGERVTLHPPRQALGPTPGQRGMEYSDVSFRTADGLTLRGWWIPGSRHQTIVMIHGLSTNRREPLDKAGYLHEAGYNLLVFDLRGHGQSDGAGTTMGYREPADARAAVAAARALDPGPIALFGYSLGAAIAVEDGAVDPEVAAVIEDSGFSSVGDVFTARFSQITKLPGIPLAAPAVAFGTLDVGTSLWGVGPLAMPARLHKPLLAIVGDLDTVVPPSEGLALFQSATGPRRLLEVPNAGHVQAYDVSRALYEATVLEFLKESLTSS